AAALGDRVGAVGPRPGGRSVSQQLYDIATVLLLLLGGVALDGIGWFGGVVLLWASRRWSIRDKIFGTLVVPLGLAAPLRFAIYATSRACSGGEVDGRAIPEVC